MLLLEQCCALFGEERASRTIICGHTSSLFLIGSLPATWERSGPTTIYQGIPSVRELQPPAAHPVFRLSDGPTGTGLAKTLIAENAPQNH
ncbi:hypothetical protein Vi05172_g3449 [Venturia inaequalis]|nr:hypothetical protein Vi05172_g3449 [Venturia inaequalis]